MSGFEQPHEAGFACSTDRQSYTEFGPVFTIKFGKWTGAPLGYCWNEKEEASYTDSDGFRYDYDGPEGATPNSPVQ